MRRVLVSALIVSTVLGMGAVRFTGWVATAGGPAPAKSVGVQLPVENFRAIELDEDRGRLYLAQGVGGGLPLVVTDLDGKLLSEVDAVRDVSDVMLSDDGRTLLAARTGTGKNKQTAYLTVTWSTPMTGNLANSVNDYYWWITASPNGGPSRNSGAAG